MPDTPQYPGILPTPTPGEVNLERTRQRVVESRDATIQAVHTPAIEGAPDITPEGQVTPEANLRRSREALMQLEESSPERYLADYMRFELERNLLNRGIKPEDFYSQWNQVDIEQPGSAQQFNRVELIKSAEDWAEFTTGQRLDLMIRTGVPMENRGWFQQHLDAWRISRIQQELNHFYGVRAMFDAGQLAPEFLQGNLITVWDPERVAALEEELATIPTPYLMNDWFHGFTLMGVTMVPQMWEYTKGGLVWAPVGAGIGGVSGSLAGGVGAVPGAIGGGLTAFGKGFQYRMAVMSIGGVRRQVAALRTPDGQPLDETTANVLALTGGFAVYALNRLSFEKLNHAILGVPASKIGQATTQALAQRGGEGLVQSLTQQMTRAAGNRALRTVGQTGVALLKAGGTEFWTEMAQEGVTDLTVFAGRALHEATGGTAFEKENLPLSAHFLRYWQSGVAGFQGAVGFGAPMAGARLGLRSATNRVLGPMFQSDKIVAERNYTNENWRSDVLAASDKLHLLNLPDLDTPALAAPGQEAPRPFFKTAVAMLRTQQVNTTNVVDAWGDAEGLTKFVKRLESVGDDATATLVRDAILASMEGKVPEAEATRIAARLNLKAEENSFIRLDIATLMASIPSSAVRAELLRNLSVDMDMVRPVETNRLEQLVQEARARAEGGVAFPDQVSVQRVSLQAAVDRARALGVSVEGDESPTQRASTLMVRALEGVRTREQAAPEGGVYLFDIIQHAAAVAEQGRGLPIHQVLDLFVPPEQADTDINVVVDQINNTAEAAAWYDRVRETNTTDAPVNPDSARQTLQYVFGLLSEADSDAVFYALMGLRNWWDSQVDDNGQRLMEPIGNLLATTPEGASVTRGIQLVETQNLRSLLTELIENNEAALSQNSVRRVTAPIESTGSRDGLGQSLTVGELNAEWGEDGSGRLVTGEMISRLLDSTVVAERGYADGFVLWAAVEHLLNGDLTAPKLAALAEVANTLMTQGMDMAESRAVELLGPVDVRVLIPVLHNLRNASIASYELMVAVGAPIQSRVAQVYEVLTQTRAKYHTAAEPYLLKHLRDETLVNIGFDRNRLLAFQQLAQEATNEMVDRALDDAPNLYAATQAAQEEARLDYNNSPVARVVQQVRDRGGFSRAELRAARLTKAQSKTLYDWGLVVEDEGITPETALQRYNVPWSADAEAVNAGAALVDGDGNVTITLRDGRRVTKILNDAILQEPVWLFRDGTKVTQDGRVFFADSLEAPWLRPADLQKQLAAADRRLEVDRRVPQDPDELASEIRLRRRADVQWRDRQAAAGGDQDAQLRLDMAARLEQQRAMAGDATRASRFTGDAGVREATAFVARHGVHPFTVVGLPSRLQRRVSNPAMLLTRAKAAELGIDWAAWEAAPFFPGDPDIVGTAAETETQAQYEARLATDPEWNYFTEVTENAQVVADADAARVAIAGALARMPKPEPVTIPPPAAELDVSGLKQDVRGIPVSSLLDDAAFAELGVDGLKGFAKLLRGMGTEQQQVDALVAAKLPPIREDTVPNITKYGLMDSPKFIAAHQELIGGFTFRNLSDFRNADDVMAAAMVKVGEQRFSDMTMAELGDPATQAEAYTNLHNRLVQLSGQEGAQLSAQELALQMRRVIYNIAVNRRVVELAQRLHTQLVSEDSSFLDGEQRNQFGPWNKTTFDKALEASTETHTPTSVRQMRNILVKFGQAMGLNLSDETLETFQAYLATNEGDTPEAVSVLPGEVAMFHQLHKAAVAGTNAPATSSQLTTDQLVDLANRLADIEARGRAKKQAEVEFLKREPIPGVPFVFSEVIRLLGDTLAKRARKPAGAEDSGAIASANRFFNHGYRAASKLITLLMREADNFVNYKGRAATTAEVGPFEKLFSLSLQEGENQRLELVRLVERGGEVEGVQVTGINTPMNALSNWWNSLTPEQSEAIETLPIPKPLKSALWERLFQEGKQKGLDDTKASEQADARAGVAVPFDRVTPELLLMVVLNLGNDANRRAMIEGWRLTEADLDAYINALPEAQWQHVQSIWGTLGVLRKPVFDAHRSVLGITPQEVRPNRIHLRRWRDTFQAARDRGLAYDAAVAEADATGAFVEGGYFPLRFDLENSDPATIEARRLGDPTPIQTSIAVMDQQDDNAAFMALFPPSAHRSFTHGRKETSGGLAPKLSLGVLSEHLEAATRYAAYAERIWGLDRMVTDQDFRNAFINRFGQAKYDLLRRHFREMLSPERRSRDWGDRFLTGARQRAVTYYMFANVGPLMRQPASIFLSVREVGLVPTLKAGIEVTMDTFRDMFSRLPGAEVFAKFDAEGRRVSMWREALENSPKLRERFRGLDATMMEASEFFRLEGLEGRYHHVAKAIHMAGFAPLQAIDRIMSIVTWHAAVNQAELAGVDRQWAINRADQAVALTQGSPFAPDRTAFQNSRGMTSLFNMFLTSRIVYANMVGHDLNYIAENGLFGTDAAKRVPGALLGWASAFGGMALWMYLVRGFWSGFDRDEKDERPLGEKIAQSIGQDFLGSFPLYGDIARVLGETSGAMQAQFGTSTINSAAIDFMNRMLRGIGAYTREASEMFPSGEGFNIRGVFDADVLSTPDGYDKAILFFGLSLAVMTGLPADRVLSRFREGMRQMEEDDGTILNILYPDPTRWGKRQRRGLPGW